MVSDRKLKIAPCPTFRCGKRRPKLSWGMRRGVGLRMQLVPLSRHTNAVGSSGTQH